MNASGEENPQWQKRKKIRVKKNNGEVVWPMCMERRRNQLRKGKEFARKCI